MSGTALILVGVCLVVAGFAIVGSGNKNTVRVGNTGVSVFGSVKQSFRSVGMTIKGERRSTARDWVGWGLSLCGVVIGLLGFIN